MTYKCLNPSCSHIFEEGEQGVRVERHPYGDTTAEEKIAVCPVCGGDFEEAAQCKHCGGAYLEQELKSGFCSDCLREMCTPERFLEYATEGAESHPTWPAILEEFMLRQIFEIDSEANPLLWSSPKFRGFCTALFNGWKQNPDQRTLNSVPLARDIHAYMDGLALWRDFADWLTIYGKE